MGNITKNFSFYEFRPFGTSKSWKPISDYQELLIITLAKELQKVRDLVIKSPMEINSGVREYSDYQRLLDSGYKPSETSDHYFSNVIPIKVNNPKYKIFGKYYIFSVGAVDVEMPNIDDNFKKIIKYDKQGIINFGQIILEKNNNSKWIHFSNDYNKFFMLNIVKLINKERYLQSLDNGKTYQKVNV